MNFKKIVKSDQEQAIASWINYLNQIRLNNLMNALNKENLNFEDAIEHLDKMADRVNEEIIKRNRGGIRGMHGFIAEVAECGIGNSREAIKGKPPIYNWINDDGINDIKKGDIFYQLKFSNANNKLSLEAVKKHLNKYPNYLKNGGKYQIPSDHYEKINELLSMSKEQADKMPTDSGKFSLKQWKYVHEFFEKNNIKREDIEPSLVSYDEVQVNQFDQTIVKEKDSLKHVNEQRKDVAYDKYKPRLKEGIHAAGVAATFEGGTDLILEIMKKRKDGKKISEFTEEDWSDIFKKTGLGVVKGGIRGISVYSLTNYMNSMQKGTIYKIDIRGVTNYTAVPAAIASSLCTASFGMAEQANKLRKGEITQDDFLMNSEVLYLDASISALSSLLGQTFIPIPVLGAVIGNTIGSFMYETAKDGLSSHEKKIVLSYLKELNELDRKLDLKYKNCIKKLNVQMKNYYVLLNESFSPNYEEAMNGSIKLAKYFGVSSDELLTSIEDVDNYFMN